MTQSRTYKRLLVVLLTCVCTVPASRASARQDGGPDKAVTREEFGRFLEEYRQLKSDVDRIQEENGQLKKQVAELQRENTARRQVDWSA